MTTATDPTPTVSAPPTPPESPAALDDRPLAALLAEAASGARLELGHSMWGFGGVHGGLALALLTAAMERRAEGRVLRWVSGAFRRPLRDAFDIEVETDGAGRSVRWLSARALAAGTTSIEARAVFAAPSRARAAPMAPPPPLAPPALDCPTFTVPPELVPFARRTEIRPVGAPRPFAGLAEPELVAWLRLVDDDAPIDAARLVLLMDALAPSYAAVLATPTPVPTLTFTVTPGAGLAGATSPWLLLRARTDLASRDGWLMERLDAWSPEGAHLGSAEQVRVVMGGR